MNQFSQQSGNYQGQQGYQSHVPTGYVQSHYQGQLSQPTFGRQTNSIVGGYQGSNSYNQGTQYIPSSFSPSMNAGSYNSYSHQPVQSHAQSPATAFGNVGPVIAHYGYQAGPDRQQGFQQSSAAGYGQQQYSQFGGYQAQPQGGYGMSQVQSYTTSEHPVYEATNAYQQAGPVISRVGYQANSQGYSQNSNNFR